MLANQRQYRVDIGDLDLDWAGCRVFIGAAEPQDRAIWNSVSILAGRQASAGRRSFGDSWRQRSALSKPETAHMRRGMFSPHHMTKLVHTIEIARFGVEQLNDAPKVIG